MRRAVAAAVPAATKGLRGDALARVARSLAFLLSTAALLGAHRAPTVFDLDRVGRAAPPIVLTLADGATLPLNALRGKPAYVFLFASWCEPCAIAMPWVRAAYAAYGDRVQFVGIDVLDAHATAEAFVREQKLPFDVAIVDKSAIDAIADDNARLDAGVKYQIPADYVIDAAGVVRAAWHGIPVDRSGTPVDVLPEALAKVAP